MEHAARNKYRLELMLMRKEGERTHTRPLPQARELHYDVVGHPRCDFRFSVVFPFHSATEPGGSPQVCAGRGWADGHNDPLSV
jgi:hypothetical protein